MVGPESAPVVYAVHVNVGDQLILNIEPVCTQ